MNFVIDYSKWRCGWDSKDSLGMGETYLWNKEGFGCCLGHFGLCLGISKESMLGVPTVSGCLPDKEGIERFKSEFGEIPVFAQTSPLEDDLSCEADMKERARSAPLTALMAVNDGLIIGWDGKVAAFLRGVTLQISQLR